MSVTLYEGALRALLDTQEGPVGRYVQRVAEAVVVQAQVQFDDYFHGVLPAEQDIDFSMEGSTATVGYVDGPGKSKSRRLAAAEAEGKLTNPPIRQALERVRAGN
jgi:hypothetical protein